jgi:hypothetical protein
MGEISNSQTWCIKPRHVLKSIVAFIRVADKEKKFLINLNKCKVHAKKLKYEGKL